MLDKSKQETGFSKLQEEEKYKPVSYTHLTLPTKA